MKTTGSLRHLLRLVLIVGFPFLLVAEDPAPPRSGSGMTLNDCVRLARERSPLLSVAAQDRLAAGEAIGESRAAYYPTLGVRGGVSRWQTHAFLPSGLGNPNLPSIIGPTDDWNAGGFARYLLLDSGARHAGLAAAHSLEDVAAHNADSVRQAVILEVHEAFYQLAAAMELRGVAEHGLKLAESHLEIAKNRQAVGDKTESDVLRAQVEVDNARVERVRTDSLIRAAKGSLNTAMGVQAETPIEIDAAAALAVPVDDMTVSNALEQALQSRPEIQAAQSAVENARQRVGAARSEFGPRVYADGNYGWRDDSSALEDEAWSAGVTVELTAFEGFAKRRQLGRARAGQARAAAALEQVKLAVRRDVWSACARLDEARQLAEAAVTQVRDAGESLRLVSERYTVGAASVSDLLAAQTALTAAEARQVQSRWGCQQASAELRRAMGTLTVDE